MPVNLYSAPTGSGMSMDEKLQQRRAAAVKRAASPATGVSSTEPVNAPMVRPNAAPAEGISSEPAKPDPILVRPNAAPVEGVPTTTAPNSPVAPATAPPPAKTAFDLERERVAADKVMSEKIRMDAIERRLAGQGLDDSGIRLGQERSAMADIASASGRQFSEIAQEESRQGFAAGESEKDRAARKDEFDRGLSQAKELALAGLDIQKTSLALQEKGMSKQDAQFYASMAQADKHAQMGFNLQKSAQELTAQGMSQQDAQYYAGLSQARYLAEKGLTLEEIRIALQSQGLSQQDAQFYAGLSQQEDLTKEGITADIQKGILIEQMSKIPVDEFYTAKVRELLDNFGLGKSVFPNGTPTATGYTPTTLPAGTKTPPGDKWTFNRPGGPAYPGGSAVYYYNPDTDTYQEKPNPKYRAFYK